MIVATWNVNGLRARLDFVLNWLRAREPDVVGLQELKLTDEQFPHGEFARLGYTAVTHGQKSWNGVAVLSRRPAELVAAGLPGQSEMGARLLSVRVDDLVFSTVYVPNGKTVEHADFRRKLAWLDALVDHYGAAADLGVLCGDFNLVPTSLDSWSEERLGGGIFHTAEERSRFAKLLALGYHDAFRELQPEDPGFSWWDYRGGAFHKKQGLRIDLVLLSKALRERATAAWVDRDYRKKQDGMTASDHAPVVVELT